MSNLIAMAAFSLVMSISPGPVNLITLSIGANSGYRKALPFVAGATIGFTLLLFLIGLGLGELLLSAPYFMKSISLIGTIFLCYLGVMIASSNEGINARDNGQPGFVQGALLQWLNPKAWSACLAGVSIFSTDSSNGPLYTFVGIYFVVCFFGIYCWAILGEKALSVISNPYRIRLFNRTMGSLLVAVALFMLLQQFHDV